MLTAATLLKKDRSWRPCGDYHRLNNATTPDRYPLPNISDLAANFHGCKVFSKIDLVKGYHQVPVAAADIPKTTIITLLACSSTSTCRSG